MEAIRCRIDKNSVICSFFHSFDGRSSSGAVSTKSFWKTKKKTTKLSVSLNTTNGLEAHTLVKEYSNSMEWKYCYGQMVSPQLADSVYVRARLVVNIVFHPLV